MKLKSWQEIVLLMLMLRRSVSVLAPDKSGRTTLHAAVEALAKARPNLKITVLPEGTDFDFMCECIISNPNDTHFNIRRTGVALYPGHLQKVYVSAYNGLNIADQNNWIPVLPEVMQAHLVGIAESTQELN